MRESCIENTQFLEQDATGPAVAGDMMHGEHENVVLGSQTQ